MKMKSLKLGILEVSQDKVHRRCGTIDVLKTVCEIKWSHYVYKKRQVKIAFQSMLSVILKPYVKIKHCLNYVLGNI